MTNKEKRQAMNERYQDVLNIMFESLVSLLADNELTGESKLLAVKMLDAVRHEMNIDYMV